MKNTKNNTVFVVMGSGDNAGTTVQYSTRVYTSFDEADKYRQALKNAYFSQVSMLEIDVETTFNPDTFTFGK
jgi:hypothetical protein